jgi:hypothetical protein
LWLLPSHQDFEPLTVKVIQFLLLFVIHFLLLLMIQFLFLFVIHFLLLFVIHFLLLLVTDLLPADLMLSLNRPEQPRFALPDSLAAVGTGQTSTPRILRRLVVMTTPSAAKGVWRVRTLRRGLDSCLFCIRETIS